jgi:uncharacterized protein YggE
MERTIKVKGTGKISVKPDTIKIFITASKVCKEYDQAVRGSSEDTSLVREAIERAGLEPKQLKTIRIDIDSEYEGYRDKNGEYKSRFIGYKYTHNMYVQFPNDNVQLGKILYELACCDVDTEFSIRHTVRDIETAKNKLLEKAVDDSTSKANILAAAAGVSLGEIKSIDYSWAELEIYSEPMDGFMMAETSSLTSSDSFDIDIEADDIDVRDTVTIEWEIR